jgi:hypothetical protein
LRIVNTHIHLNHTTSQYIIHSIHGHGRISITRFSDSQAIYPLSYLYEPSIPEIGRVAPPKRPLLSSQRSSDPKPYKQTRTAQKLITAMLLLLRRSLPKTIPLSSTFALLPKKPFHTTSFNMSDMKKIFTSNSMARKWTTLRLRVIELMMCYSCWPLRMYNIPILLSYSISSWLRTISTFK